MKISFNWLKELVDIPWSPAETAEKLAQLGFPAESVTTTGVQVSNVISVKILSVSRHPNADRLQIAQVTDGKEDRTIVCGAPNIAVGQVVPCALPGAKLPGGIEIAISKIRGVESRGMLCSERELALSTEHAGIFQFPTDAPLGKEVGELLGGSDTVIDIEVTPNRPDMLSYIGVARELAALAKTEVKWPVPKFKAATTGEACVIEINDLELCPRYIGRLIHGVKVGPSPDWMVRRLKACGIRSINNIVDITNYVLMEWGHPLHAFDLAKLSGKKVVVRKAKPGEKILALDEKTYSLEPHELIIADAESPVAIAGIMGGQLSGVNQRTSDILLESAVFDRTAIRKTSRRLVLRSESSLRFEKGTDAETAEKASLRAAALIIELAGGKPGKSLDVYKIKEKYRSVSLKAKNLESLLGMEPAKKVVTDILSRLELEPKAGSAGWTCSIPTYRKDLLEEADLVEEVVRLIGYEAVPVRRAKISLGNMSESYRKWDDTPVVEALRGFGLSETITPSFCSVESAIALGVKEDTLVPLANPISKEETILRPGLLVNLIKAVQRNLNHQQASVALFELGNGFSKGNGGVVEEKRLAGVVCGEVSPKTWTSAQKHVDIFYLKSLLSAIDKAFHLDWEVAPSSDWSVLHPYQAFNISWRKQTVGVAGLLHPAFAAQLDITLPCAVFEINADVFRAKHSDRAVALPKYPFVERDIAVVIDKSKAWREIRGVVAKAGGSLLKHIDPFDLFEGGSLLPNQKSLAFRVRLQHPEHTLAEAEIAETVDKIKTALQHACGAQPR